MFDHPDTMTVNPDGITSRGDPSRFSKWPRRRNRPSSPAARRPDVRDGPGGTGREVDSERDRLLRQSVPGRAPVLKSHPDQDFVESRIAAEGVEQWIHL